MTPQKLREAAERITTALNPSPNGTDPYYDDDAPLSFDQRWRDEESMAMHILNTVFDDDDADLTDKWFFDHGFQFEPRAQCFYLQNHIGITKERGGYWFFSNEDGPGWELKKCGQFRGLCRSLNILLPTPSNESSP